MPLGFEIEIFTITDLSDSKYTHEKHDIYLGKRKKRGLFQSSVNQLINADINGSIGIARKVFGDSAVRQIIGSGLAFNPIRVNIL